QPLGMLLGQWQFLTEITNRGSEAQSPGQAEGMRDRAGKRETFLALLQSLIWVTKIPEDRGGPGEGHDPGGLSVDKRMRTMPLGVVQRNRPVPLLPGSAQLSEPE